MLRTRLGKTDDDLSGITEALQRALGDGEIGWHNDTYRGHDGPVYIVSGASGGQDALAHVRVLCRLEAHRG